MYETFENLLKSRGITAYRVSKDTGISTATLTQWKKGVSTPKQDKLQKIADYFGVTIEYLMTGKEDEEEHLPYYLNDETIAIAQAAFENPDMRSLFDMSRKMSPERLKAHLDFMRKLQEAEENNTTD